MHKRTHPTDHPSAWYDMSCCMPRQHCTERHSWVSIQNESVPVVNIHGLPVALGNINFHEERLRACLLDVYRRYDSVCP